MGTPLRPIISSRVSATYETAKELAKIIKPLIGKSPHHVYNNKDFLESIKDIKVEEDECIMSYDVSALFTSIPIDTTIDIIKKQLEDDKDLHSRSNMTIKHICCLLEFCLKNTYFKFNGKFYEQKEGAAMGSPISPIVANLFMEDLETKAIRTSSTPPKIWRRFVGDTFTIIKKKNKNSFLQHLNSIHPSIKFACEEEKEDGSMPFLYILLTPAEDGSLNTSVFRKPTHTDLYLQWDSHHNMPSKYSVAGTLYHRATTICSNPTLLHEEEQHLFNALKMQVPHMGHKQSKTEEPEPQQKQTKKSNKPKRPKNQQHSELVHGGSISSRPQQKSKENMQQIWGTGTFKRRTDHQSLLMAPKDNDPINNKSGVIYRYQCNEQGCGEEYIGESGRTFAERLKEHQKPPSLIFDHCNTSGHNININKFTIMGREDQNLTRAIKEAILIRVNDPSLNRNVGKYHLPHIWDEVLHRTSELKFKH